MSILQWVLLLAILSIAFRHSYRAKRITCFSFLFTWGASALCELAFAAYLESLGRAEQSEWFNKFPDGSHVFGMVLFGWIYGVIVGALAVGIGRLVRKEPLFRFLQG